MGTSDVGSRYHRTAEETADWAYHMPALVNCRKCVRFEVLMAVTGVFWDITPRGSCKNRRFGGT
jgi:hypothetical protein